MTRVRLDERLSVAPQLTKEDVAAAAARGFRLLICNRPDGEAEGQPDAASLAAEAHRHGLAFIHIPVVGGAIGSNAVHAFHDALAKAPGPVLAFCRSGMRSTALWALGEAGRRPVDELIAAARRAGFDLAAMRGALEAAAARGAQER